MKFIDDELSRMQLKFIITARNKIDSKYTFIAEPMPSKYQREIFDKILNHHKQEKDVDFNKEEFDSFSTIINHNTLLLTLSASCLTASDSKLEKSDLLNPDEWVWYAKRFPKVYNLYQKDHIKKNIKNKKNSQISLKQYMECTLDFFISVLPKDDIIKLSIWAKTIIPVSLLKTIYPEIEIEIAVEYGILEYTDAEHLYIKMPSLLADAAWFQAESQEIPICPKTINCFSAYINSANKDMPQLSIPILYDIILNMINKVYYKSITKRSDEIRSSKKVIESLKCINELLEKMIDLLFKLGNYQTTEKLVNRLYKYRTLQKQEFDISNESQKIYKKIYQCVLYSLINNDYTLFKKEIEIILKDSYSSDFTTPFIFIATFQMDYILLCQMRITYDFINTMILNKNYNQNIQQMTKSILSLQQDFDNLLQILYQINDHTKTNYPYYYACKCILPLFDNNIFEYLSQIIEPMKTFATPDIWVQFFSLLIFYQSTKYISLILSGLYENNNNDIVIYNYLLDLYQDLLDYINKHLISTYALQLFTISNTMYSLLLYYTGKTEESKNVIHIMYDIAEQLVTNQIKIKPELIQSFIETAKLSKEKFDKILPND